MCECPGGIPGPTQTHSTMSNESLSARKGSEKSEGLHSDHRGISQARSSEGGNGGLALDVSIQSREPVDSNTVPVWRASPEQIHAKDVDPATSIFNTSR